jgi:hypothetical protein
MRTSRIDDHRTEQYGFKGSESNARHYVRGRGPAGARNIVPNPTEVSISLGTGACTPAESKRPGVSTFSGNRTVYLAAM